MTNKLPPTTVVGSYVQPLWLVNRDILHCMVPPRVRAKEIWRIPAKFLKEAQDAATLVAIRDMEWAGIDIISDCEMCRESYSNNFATALGGVSTEKPVEVPGRSGRPIRVPPDYRSHFSSKPIQTKDVEFLRKHTPHPIKVTLPGPFTMTQTAVDAERLIIAPDCGMKYLKRTTAFGKLKTVAKGAEMVRKELTD